MNNKFTASVKLFERKMGWHYVSVPTDLSKPLEHLADRGLIAVTAKIGNDIASLKGKDPEEVYQRDCLYQGVQVDRCALYCYRLAVHYADHGGKLPPDKRNWWNWNDKKEMSE